MTLQEQNEAARQFVNRWKKRGYEKGDTQSFWIEFLHGVLGFDNVTQRLQFEKQVEIGEKDTNYIDVYIPETKVIIEQKSLKIDLDKPQPHHSNKTPYEQAFEYNTHLTADQKANWIITSNFREIRIYDMNKSERERKPIIYTLDELQTKYSAFEFLFNKEVKTISKEMEVSMQAGELVGKLYDELYKNYAEPNEETLKSLNILCVRLVFCMYAEDAGLFGKKDMFHDYLIGVEPKKIRRALKDLFRILDTPENERDADEDEDLLQFPYVNGGLFSKEDILIPQFTEELKYILLEKASKDFDWSEISPTIFGAVFESTLNPDTRRAGGMHYTSIENIHKVIDPLFLDELKNEFNEIVNESTILKSLYTENIEQLSLKYSQKTDMGGEISSLTKEKYKEIGTEKRKFTTSVKQSLEKLNKLQEKLASLNFLDPACGSGNFLTETYLSIRRLENDIILFRGKLEQTEGQMTFVNPIKVSISQFYGIEINDFAVTVAKTALWIAESQMIKETEKIINIPIDFFPLVTNAFICEGNALKIKWDDVLPTKKCSYIMGNPPFSGTRVMSEEQKMDVINTFGKKWPSVKSLDYVSCWYKVASEYMHDNPQIKSSFVSTNSITQGEQVPILWEGLMEKYGIDIIYAYTTFVWNSEAQIKAKVHCVIIGFSINNGKDKKMLFEGKNVRYVENINPYLKALPSVFIKRQDKPLCNTPLIYLGCTFNDNNHLIFTKEEKDEFIAKEPESSRFFRPYVMGKDFIERKPRYCLWLKDASPKELKSMREIIKKLELVKSFRLSCKNAETVKTAQTPAVPSILRYYEHEEYTDYIAIPKVSSSRRTYIPIELLDKDFVAGDKIFLMPHATKYHFGVLTSNVHMAWVNAFCGRLKSDYSYASKIVYNTFPWPTPTPEQKKKIEKTAQMIIDARAIYPDSSLADLYDPLTMPIELQKAHTQNDIAVMQAYGFNIKEMTEADCVAELMKMYQKMISL